MDADRARAVMRSELPQGPVDAERRDRREAGGPEHDPAELETAFRSWGVSAVLCLSQKRSVVTAPDSLTLTLSLHISFSRFLALTN